MGPLVLNRSRLLLNRSPFRAHYYSIVVHLYSIGVPYYSIRVHYYSIFTAQRQYTLLRLPDRPQATCIQLAVGRRVGSLSRYHSRTDSVNRQVRSASPIVDQALSRTEIAPPTVGKPLPDNFIHSAIVKSIGQTPQRVPTSYCLPSGLHCQSSRVATRCNRHSLTLHCQWDRTAIRCQLH